jgi:hypothetical protein
MKTQLLVTTTIELSTLATSLVDQAARHDGIHGHPARISYDDGLPEWHIVDWRDSEWVGTGIYASDFARKLDHAAQFLREADVLYKPAHEPTVPPLDTVRCEI